MQILIVDDEPKNHDAYRQCLTRAFDLGFACDQPFELTHTDHAGLGEVLAKTQPEIAFVGPGLVADILLDSARRLRSTWAGVDIVIANFESALPPHQLASVAGPADKLFYLSAMDVKTVTSIADTLARRRQTERELANARAELAKRVEVLEAQARELAANELKAIHLASHDPLTDAPNRLAFGRALTRWVAGDVTFAMAMMDLDRFKLVNDTFGHVAGDELIRTTCRILQAEIPSGGMVARLGGDEFALLFPIDGEEAAVLEAERLVRACSGTFRVFGNSVHGGASIGLVVITPEEGASPDDVMRRADLALNDAKRAARGSVCVYDASMDAAIRFRRAIEYGLASAIEKGELRLVYQPIVAHDTLNVIAFEALMRWDSPEHGTLSPATFIPIAEESNLIHDLGDWVLDEALKMLARWPDQYVSVNFSPRQFRRQNFVGHVVKRVDRAGVSPTRLQIEITETAIFDDAERAADTLYRLRQMGFRIALDDFGTGYSSLYNIRKFALDCLKIDRDFIEGMGRERESVAIVHSIIHLGRALGLEVVAEGVETQAQVQALRIAGCSHLQGFHLSPPVEAEQTIEMVGERQALPLIQPPRSALVSPTHIRLVQPHDSRSLA